MLREGTTSIAMLLSLLVVQVGDRAGSTRPTLFLGSQSTPGNIRLIHLLLDAGAIVDPERVTRYNGRTPIQAAAESGHEEVVLLLLDLGANINAPASPSSGVTALQAACFQGHVDLVRLLIKRGANVNSPPGNQMVSRPYKGLASQERKTLLGCCLIMAPT